jgi:predicted nucleic acid-binding Zn ribbon protein
MKRPVQISALLETVFAGKPAQKRIREAKAWQFWEEAVGSHIASKATPVAFRDGTLTVRVSSSAWMQQLSLMKRDIIGQLNDAIGYPLVNDLFFRQGTVQAKEAESVAVGVRKRSLTDAEQKLLIEQTTAVSDPELRDAFISLFSSQLAVSPRK